LGQTYRKLRATFPAAKIHSFEPAPETFAKLQAAVHGDPNAVCVPFALGDAAAQAQLSIIASDSGQNTLNVSARPGVPTISVRVTTADAYAAASAIDQIDLLKIDTEGYEASVLRGASRLLDARAIRFVLAECDFTPNPSEPHGDFFTIAQLLLPRGYRVASFYTGGLDGGGWRWGDVLFMLPHGPRPVTCSPFARK
jgi:FkbM family methyltransferase